jgi:glycine/D-amino acid oxidase-like deaminating enzyme
MAGLDLPVEPRKRFTYVFQAAEPLDQPLPLTIDPSGVHVRSDGDAYLAGCKPDIDHAVEPDDLTMDADLWESKVWPVLAHRIPAFERIKVMTRWAGHYAYNTLDQNAVVGPHPELDGFLFINGFSGHGLQQAAAMGRGVAEWISYGEFRSIDLTPLGVERVIAGQPFAESAVI